MRTAAGDLPDDFVAFCRTAHPRLVAALTHHTGERHLAEECAQEALIRAGLRWSRVRTLDSPIGWTFHVGTNVARSTFRRRSAERRALQRHGTPEAAAPSTDVASAIDVRRALAELSTREREAVVLRHLLGCSTAEAAATMRTTTGALRALTHRGVAKLRARLDFDPGQPDAEHEPEQGIVDA